MKKLLGLSAATIALLSFAGIASAQIVVGVQYPLYDSLTPTDVAGAVAVPNWNVLLPAEVNTDDSGSQTDKTISGAGLAGYNISTSSNIASTTINATLTYDSQFESDDSATDPNTEVLLRASFFTRNTDDTPTALTALTLNIGGLASTDTYNLYVYIEPPTWGSPSSATITDGTQTFNITGDKSLTTLTQITGSNADGNYVEFTGISGAPGSVNVSIPGANTVGVAGFQLVDTGAAVPEPSTVWLMGLGLAGMVFFVQRKRRASL